MKKKSPVELEKSLAIKASRTVIRLKHSLAADRELNETLPTLLAEFDASISRGELKTLKYGIEDALGGGVSDAPSQ